MSIFIASYGAIAASLFMLLLHLHTAKAIEVSPAIMLALTIGIIVWPLSFICYAIYRHYRVEPHMRVLRVKVASRAWSIGPHVAHAGSRAKRPAETTKVETKISQRQRERQQKTTARMRAYHV